MSVILEFAGPVAIVTFFALAILLIAGLGAPR